MPPRLLALVLLLAAPLLFAHPSMADGPDEVQWSLGAGVVFSPRPYAGADAEVFPVPLLGVRYKGFYFETIRAGYRFHPHERLGIDLFAAARFDGFDEDDAEILRGMDEPKTSADLGVRFTGEWDRVELGLQAAADVLDRSDGREVQLDLGFPLEAGAWRITPLLGARWWSDDMVHYYYGVDPDESRADRPAYRGDAATSGLAEVSFRRPFAARWFFLGSVEAVFLGSEIVDSPLVDDDVTVGGFLGFSYRFGR